MLNDKLISTANTGWRTALCLQDIGDVCYEDNDNDSMPDDWETEHGLDPLVNDVSGDPDDDGYTNLEEYQFSTDANNTHSIPTRKATFWIPLLLDE